MKLAVLILVLPLIVCACAPPCIPYLYGSEEIPDLGIETPADALAWVAINITFRRDDDDEWQDPRLTYELGHGDCEDYCLLVMYLTYRDTEEWMTMLVGRDGGEYGDHAWVELGGEWWEPQENRRCEDYEDRYGTIRDNRNLKAWYFILSCS